MESGGLLGGGRGAPRAQPQAPELRGEAMPRRGLRAPAHSARMAWPGPPPRAKLFPRLPRNGAGPGPGSVSGSGSGSAQNGRGGGGSGGARDGSITPGRGGSERSAGGGEQASKRGEGGRRLRARLSPALPPRTGPPPPAPVRALNRSPAGSC